VTTRTVLRAGVLAVAIALATLALGWPGVPLAGAAWGLISRDSRGAGVAAALGGALGWGALLMWDAARGPLAALVAALGASLGVPAWAPVLLTLVLPATLGWGAAVVAGEAARLVRGSR
jgi:hypothetical protein